MKSTTRYRGEIAKPTLEGVQTPIVGTWGHPIYSEDGEGFVPLGDLESGEAVRTTEGWAIVESLARMWSEGTTVHNLEVEGEHRFLVGSAGVVSHNASSGSCPAAGGGGCGSPNLDHSDLKGKTAEEIRQLAKDKGLVPDPRRPDKWLDPVTGKERLRIDNGHIDRNTGLPYDDPKAAAPHHHGYGPDGEIKITDPSDGNPHIPTRQE